jgi:hypothetical protein
VSQVIEGRRIFGFVADNEKDLRGSFRIRGFSTPIHAGQSKQSAVIGAIFAVRNVIVVVFGPPHRIASVHQALATFE